MKFLGKHNNNNGNESCQRATTPSTLVHFMWANGKPHKTTRKVHNNGNDNDKVITVCAPRPAVSLLAPIFSKLAGFDDVRLNCVLCGNVGN